MNKIINKDIPSFDQLINPTIQALQNLGGSGRNDEIYEEVLNILNLPNEVVEAAHLGNTNQTEIEYRLAWARTYLKKYGIINNSKRSVWVINPNHSDIKEVDSNDVVQKVRSLSSNKQKPTSDGPEAVGLDVPDEVKPWRKRLNDILLEMDPFAFERLSQLLLRECGFDDVHVTKKTGDGGIDGTGKLKINGVFSFNIAFQCKRYKGAVSAGDIRDFRGSLTTDIEKGVFITTGSFSKPAIEEAYNTGKQQIDLIDGEDFINKLAEYGIGVKEITDYEVDESYFSQI